jgi:D-alanine-D-alanine ligase
MKKYKLLIICGGKSPEHEISIISAKSVIENLDKTKYEIAVLGIEKNSGEWFLYNNLNFYEKKDKLYILNKENRKKVYVDLGSQEFLIREDGTKVSVDLVFPVIHGINSEDGKLQAVLETVGLKFIGCDTLSSAICMDKLVAKILARSVGVSVVPWLEADKNTDLNSLNVKYPVFVKAVASGSSIGVYKVKDIKELQEKVKEALFYSNKVIIEEAVVGREIELAILGNWNSSIKVSVPGEICPNREFYDYTAKYLDEKGAELIAPAIIEQDILEKLENVAKSVFKVLRCSGMARIDFFLTENNYYFNEINTIPGFTSISMYPKLFNLSGISYSKLLDHLINLAMEK